VRDTQIFTYWRGDRKKCIEHRRSFKKKINNWLLKTRGYPYFLCYEMEVASLFNAVGCGQRKAVRDAKSAVATTLLFQTHQQWFLYFHSPRSFKIFINMFAFQYLKANLTEICKEISFLSFSEKC